MRIVEARRDLVRLLAAVRAEAGAAFGSDAVYLEKLLRKPRHVEFQVFGDEHGNVVHMGERECSIQRRHQKLIEESPSMALDDSLRQRMAAAAVEAASAVGYANAGTVEFLLDEHRDFFFIEMNTRIQVEHPVTEGVTGIDLVKEQIQVAAGAPLSMKQSDITFHGSAIECRINAEDPDTFTPSPGRISAFHMPGGPGLRVDTACHVDCVVSPFYDSMIAKLISYGNNRTEAISRMRRALESFVIEGIKTTIPTQLRILADPDFQAGNFDTSFMERFQAPKGTRPGQATDKGKAAAPAG
jgi:acetyl-CoA carboxylase biotin carboxylase subunit